MRNFWMNRWTIFFFLSSCFFLFIYILYFCLPDVIAACTKCAGFSDCYGDKWTEILYIHVQYGIYSIYKYAMQYSPFLSCQPMRTAMDINVVSQLGLLLRLHLAQCGNFFYFFIIALPVEKTLRVALDLVDLQVVPENK